MNRGLSPGVASLIQDEGRLEEYIELISRIGCNDILLDQIKLVVVNLFSRVKGWK